jgi:two-component system, OmpR family, response regulator
MRPENPAPPLVLVIDGDAAGRRAITVALGLCGVDVRTAAGGGEGVELFRTLGRRVALVLLAPRPPEADGPATLAALRLLDPCVRCCVLTANPVPNAAEELLAAGALDVLPKPVPFSRLAALLDAAGIPPGPLLPGPSAHPLSVLVVEDEADTADSLAELITLVGHRVTVARTGAAALRANGSPDVVLLDLGLPDMDGCEVARQFRARASAGATPKRPFLVAVTGYGRDEDVRRTEAAGIDLLLVKPADPAALLRLLARFSRAAELQIAHC